MTKEPRKSKKKIIQSLHHVPSLRETLSRLYAEKKINQERKDFILLNLGVHLGIGLVRFTVTPFPVPIGSILRPLWVMANRMYCNLKWDMHRKKTHSIAVLLFSFIPFLGFFAYTIPLKKKSKYLSYLYAEHIAYELYNTALEDKLAKVPKLIRKIGYALLVPKENRGEEQERP